MTGHLYGVGVGPGDPELITLKAARLIKDADVIAYHSGTAGRSIARTIASSLISEDVIEELLIYPVTTGPTDHPLGYYGAVNDFYDESAERLSKHWTPAEVLSYSPRVTRCSTARICIFMIGCRPASRAKSCPESPR